LEKIMTHFRTRASACALSAALAWAVPAAAVTATGTDASQFMTDMAGSSRGAIAPAATQAFTGGVKINGKLVAIEGPLPPPGAGKAVIIIGGKSYEIVKVGDGWKTANGAPLNPGVTKGYIIDWKQGATKGYIVDWKTAPKAQPGALDELPAVQKKAGPSDPGARRGPDVGVADPDDKAIGNPGFRRGPMSPPPGLAKSRRGALR